MGWEGGPFFCEPCEVGVNVLLQRLSAEFVSLGENNAERDTALAEPVHEFDINLLGFMAAVDEYEKVREVFALQDIAGDHVLQFRAFSLAALGKAVAGEVNEIPEAVFSGRGTAGHTACRGFGGG